MDEKEQRYYEACHWVGRQMSPLRGTERPPLAGSPPPKKPWRLMTAWTNGDGTFEHLTLEEGHVVPHLTKEMALQVRDWRCGIEPCTSHRVAELAYEKWDHPDWLKATGRYGDALCRISAGLLGEDPYGEPWF